MNLILRLIFGLSIISPLACGQALETNGSARIHRTLEDVALGPGRPVLLVFFSTACSVCYDDLFEVRYFVERNGLEAEVVGVTRDPESSVRTFLDKYGYRGPVVWDSEKKLFRAHKVDLEPCVVILDGGRVVYKDNFHSDLESRREERERWLVLNAAARAKRGA